MIELEWHATLRTGHDNYTNPVGQLVPIQNVNKFGESPTVEIKMIVNWVTPL